MDDEFHHLKIHGLGINNAINSYSCVIENKAFGLSFKISKI